MNAKYWQKGETLDFTASSGKVDSGDVVSLTTLIGVADSDIPANGTGRIHVTGVWEFDKDNSNITLGAAVYWKTGEKKITTTSSENVPAGYAVAAAGASETKVLVKLLG